MSRKAGTKPHHLAPLLLPLIVLSGSVAASGSCGAQSIFLKGSQLPTASISTSQTTPYQIEAFAPLEVAGPTGTVATSRPAFNPFAPIDPNAPPQIEDPYGALAPFFDALRRAEAGRPDGRVLISQFGDSHTVADFGTSKLRRLLQARFGDAGRGLVLPGRPFRGYFQRDLFSWSEGNWRVENGLRMGGGASEPFGIAGFRTIGDSPQTVSFVGTCRDEVCPSNATLSRFELFYRVTPQGGSVRLSIDGDYKENVSTRENFLGEDTIGGYWSTELPEGQHELTIRPAGDGPIELFGVVMERDQPGVIVEALGVGGTQAWHLAHWNWDYIGEQLRRRSPSLVILAYGTNESANDYTTREKIVKVYTDAITKVKTALPGVAILVVGPIDRSVQDRNDCSRYNSSKGEPIQSTPEGCQWKTAPLIPDIVSGEREAAFVTGAAFFDMFRAMGGEGTMAEWAKEDPPLGQRDHTHLTKSGYEHNAQLLYDALLEAYTHYLENAPPL